MECDTEYFYKYNTEYSYKKYQCKHDKYQKAS